MKHRYAVLREPDGDHLPMGLALEMSDYVRVLALDEYGLPKKIKEPYRVTGRDMAIIEYRPGMSGYFEQVLVELSRVASMGEQGEAADISDDSVIALFSEKVQKPRVAAPRPYLAQKKPWKGAETPWSPPAAALPNSRLPRVAA